MRERSDRSFGCERSEPSRQGRAPRSVSAAERGPTACTSYEGRNFRFPALDIDDDNIGRQAEMTEALFFQSERVPEKGFLLKGSATKEG